MTRVRAGWGAIGGLEWPPYETSENLEVAGFAASLFRRAEAEGGRHGGRIMNIGMQTPERLGIGGLRG